MMADERPSIDDILAMARSQDGGSGAPDQTPDPADESAAPTENTSDDTAQDTATEPVADDLPTTPADPPKTPKATPSSTADILSMARGQDASDAAAETKPVAEKPAEPAAKPAAKPTGVSDILAMARAQDTNTADADPEPTPAADTAPSESSPATADGDGDRPSVQEMLQQLRQTDGGGASTASPDTPQLPASERPMPSPPPAPDAPVAPPAQVGRRSALVALLLLPTQLVTSPFAIAWTALTAAGTAMVLGLARFMFPNTLVEPPMTFKIGPPSDYPPESVSTKFKADRAVWIVRSTMYNGQDQIVAVSTVCTHLGCTPNWLEGEQKFKCPCHGSGFYKSGVNFEGPAPRPLERHGLKLAPDGMLEVDKSKKFQEELGQWEEDNCFVSV